VKRNERGLSLNINRSRLPLSVDRRDRNRIHNHLTSQLPHLSTSIPLSSSSYLSPLYTRFYLPVPAISVNKLAGVRIMHSLLFLSLFLQAISVLEVTSAAGPPSLNQQQRQVLRDRLFQTNLRGPRWSMLSCHFSPKWIRE